MELPFTILITEDLRHPDILGYGWMLEQNVVLDVAQQSTHLGTQDHISGPLLRQLDTRQVKQPIELEDNNNGIPPKYQEEFLEVLNAHLRVAGS